MVLLFGSIKIILIPISSSNFFPAGQQNCFGQIFVDFVLETRHLAAMPLPPPLTLLITSFVVLLFIFRRFVYIRQTYLFYLCKGIFSQFFFFFFLFLLILEFISAALSLSHSLSLAQTFWDVFI